MKISDYGSKLILLGLLIGYLPVGLAAASQEEKDLTAAIAAVRYYWEKEARPNVKVAIYQELLRMEHEWQAYRKMQETLQSLASFSL